MNRWWDQVVQADALMLLSDLCSWSLVDERTAIEGESETRMLESKVVWCVCTCFVCVPCGFSFVEGHPASASE